jgi:hypothetical protein
MTSRSVPQALECCACSSRLASRRLPRERSASAASLQASWKDSRPERSAKISLENTRFTRPSYHEDWPAVERSRLEAVGYPRACLQVLLRALLSGGVATALACRVDG